MAAVHGVELVVGRVAVDLTQVIVLQLRVPTIPTPRRPPCAVAQDAHHAQSAGSAARHKYSQLALVVVESVLLVHSVLTLASEGMLLRARRKL